MEKKQESRAKIVEKKESQLKCLFLTYKSPKLALFIFLSLITGFLLFALVYWHPPLLYHLLFSETDPYYATHVCCVSPLNDYSYSAIVRRQINNYSKQQGKVTNQGEMLTFTEKELTYYIEDRAAYEVTYNFQDHLRDLPTNRYNVRGQADQLRKTFGRGSIFLERPSFVRILLTQIFKPFYIFIVASIAIWFVQEYYIYAGIITFTTIVSLVVNLYAILSFWQRLLSLANFTSMVKVETPTGLVQLSNDDLVPGDIVVVQKGRLSVEGIILEGSVLVNECGLTGQSNPILKKAVDQHAIKIGRQNYLYEGTDVLTAKGGQKGVRVLVTSVGFSTLRGRMVRSIKEENGEVAMERETHIYLLISLVSLIVTVLIIYFWAAKEWVQTDSQRTYYILQAITIGVPPSLPSCVTAGILVAVYKLKEQNIFCVSSTRIPQGGKIDQVCFDKTGTLTIESMQFFDLILPGQAKSPGYLANLGLARAPENRRIIECCALCHSLTIFEGNPVGEPMEVTTLSSLGIKLAEEGLVNISQTSGVGSQVKVFDFDPEAMRMSVIAKVGKEKWVYCKGSPESIAKCITSVPANYSSIVEAVASKGMRLVAMGGKKIEADCSRQQAESNLTFLGFILFQNKPKVTAFETIKQLRFSGINVCMITGDNPFTAVAIAKDLGMIAPNEGVATLNSSGEQNVVNEGDTMVYAVSNAQVQNLQQLEKDPRFQRVRVWSRMTPESKAKIVRMYKKKGKCVMMVGDGANDAIALKASDVGLSLAQTEVSIAGHFVSKYLQPISTITLLRECRAGLSISVNTFKITVAYALIQFVQALISRSVGSNVTEAQYILQDIAYNLIPMIILPFSTSSKKLSKVEPIRSLLHWNIYLSLLGAVANYSVVCVVFRLFKGSSQVDAFVLAAFTIGNYAIAAQVLGGDWIEPWRMKTHKGVQFYCLMLWLLPFLFNAFSCFVAKITPWSEIVAWAELVAVLNGFFMVFLEGRLIYGFYVGWSQISGQNEELQEEAEMLKS